MNYIEIYENNTLFVDGNNIISESLTYHSQLYNGYKFTFGGCITDTISFVIFDTNKNVEDLLGKTITVKFYRNVSSNTKYYYINDDFIVSSVKKSGTQYTVEAKGIIDKLDADVTTWYNGLTFPITVGNMIKSLCDYVSISCDTQTFAGTSEQIKSKELSGSINGRTVMQKLCESCFGFGSIEEGKFKFISGNAEGSLSIQLSDVIGTPEYTTPDEYIYLHNVAIYGDNGAYSSSGGRANSIINIRNNFVFYNKTSAELDEVIETAESESMFPNVSSGVNGEISFKRLNSNAQEVYGSASVLPLTVYENGTALFWTTPFDYTIRGIQNLVESVKCDTDLKNVNDTTNTDRQATTQRDLQVFVEESSKIMQWKRLGGTFNAGNMTVSSMLDYNEILINTAYVDAQVDGSLVIPMSKFREGNQVYLKSSHGVGVKLHYVSNTVINIESISDSFWSVTIYAR